MKRKALTMALALALTLSTGITAFAAPEVIQVNGGLTVFDSDYYAANNPDVVAAYGTDKEALIQHYINNGMSEGRAAYSPDTDVSALLGVTSKTTEKVGKQAKQMKITYPNGSVNEHVYTYDSKGNMTRDTTYSNGNLSEWYEYEYNIDGNMTRQAYYDKTGKLWTWHDYSYDIYGNMVYEIYQTYDPGKTEPRTVRTYEYEYDLMGDILEEREYSYSDLFPDYVECEKYEYIYDSNGNNTRINEYFNDELSSWTDCSYDVRGNVIQEIHYAVYNNTFADVIYNYTYDDYGYLTYENTYKYNTGINDYFMSDEHTYYYDADMDIKKEIYNYENYGSFLTRTYEYEYN